MSLRSFPIVYVRDLHASATFYEALGFARHFQFPETGEPGYIALRRGDDEIALVPTTWPTERYGVRVGDAPRFELFVYVDDVDATVDRLRADGVTVLLEPADMPWGERLGVVADPDGNPVSLGAPLAVT